tara:strand:- start:1512 stop:3053 length:1542 start_codon:yes stop_codon:yes gene_type:complete
MGAEQSAMAKDLGKKGARNPEGLRKAINEIAAQYILTSDFQRIKDLSTEDTCNKLVIMTSDLISKHLDDTEVEYLVQHLDSSGTPIDKTVRERLIFFDKSDAQGVDPIMGVQSRTKKTRMCVGIAQFYVKVFNLFAAITGTINPQLSYTDPRTQKTTVVSLLNKNKIPNGVDYRRVYNSFCSQRIGALFTPDASQNDTVAGVITIRPRVCQLNEEITKASTQKGSECKGPDGYPIAGACLSKESGMPELEMLYMDVYNYQTGKYDKMSPESKVAYQQDVAVMWEVFTGRSLASDPTYSGKIKRFSQIPLAELWRSSMCDQDKPKDSFSPSKTAPDGSLQITLPMPTIPWRQLSSQQQGGVRRRKNKLTRKGGRRKSRNTRSKRGGSRDPSTGVYRKTYVGNIKTQVYSAYAKHIAAMMSAAEAQETALLNILNRVFSTTNEQGSTVRRINPSMTYALLDDAITMTRKGIVALYQDCEKNYQKGVNLLDAIIEYQYAETAKRRNENLMKQLAAE